MSHHHIICNNVSFSYEKDTEILHEINFTAVHDDAIGLIGANGVGKSTLLRIIVGLEMGADDYVPKPCTPRELLARINAILRRAQHDMSCCVSLEPQYGHAGGVSSNTSSSKSRPHFWQEYS